MTGPGHKRAQHLIEAEAYRQIMAGEVPATLDQFAQQLLDWLRQNYPDASSVTVEMVESCVRDDWRRRHELIRGGS